MKHNPCPDCNGRGFNALSHRRCQRCQGTGYIKVKRFTTLEVDFMRATICPQCQGTASGNGTCAVCGGRGIIVAAPPPPAPPHRYKGDRLSMILSIALVVVTAALVLCLVILKSQ